MRRATLVVVALMTLAGCGGDPHEDYCAAVDEQRTELSTTLTEGGELGLLAALPQLRTLRDAAPDDIRGDWNTLVGAVEDLEDALGEAGVEPESYDPKNPPEDVSSDELSAIEAAARRLGNQATREAAERLQQQARDVCQTPLLL